MGEGAEGDVKVSREWGRWVPGVRVSSEWGRGLMEM